jgi:hypothetical protein
MSFRMSVSALFLVMASVFASASDERSLQEKADAAEWKWSDYDNSLLHCALHNLQNYELRITRPAKSDAWNDRVFRIAIFDGVTEVYSSQGHSETVFTQIGDVVFLAHLNPMCTGCAVEAFDLKQRKQLWMSRLIGNPPQVHSKYRHQVNIMNENGVVVVYGKEDEGRYIEYLDARTGKTVGHKKLPPER